MCKSLSNGLSLDEVLSYGKTVGLSDELVEKCKNLDQTEVLALLEDFKPSEYKTGRGKTGSMCDMLNHIKRKLSNKECIRLVMPFDGHQTVTGEQCAMVNEEQLRNGIPALAIQIDKKGNITSTTNDFKNSAVVFEERKDDSDKITLQIVKDRFGGTNIPLKVNLKDSRISACNIAKGFIDGGVAIGLPDDIPEPKLISKSDGICVKINVDKCTKKRS